jgi:hypothetical protein
MSILDTLADKASSKATATLLSGSWVVSAVDAGKKQTGGLDTLTATFANVALDEMLANKDKLGQVSANTFVAIISRLSLGQTDQARLIYLATDATFEERMAALDTASEATRKGKADSDAAWADFKNVVMSIMKKVGPILIQVLMAAI